MLQKSPKYVVVIGAARSGTKFVRDMIGSSADCSVVPYDVNFIWRTGNTAERHDALASSECTDRVAQQIDAKLQLLSKWYRSSKAEYVVEKTVSNCLRVPFIERALDDVRYVHLIRDGRDVVESSFRQWNEPVELKYLLQKLRYVPLSNMGYAFWYVSNLIKGITARGRGVGVWGVRYPGIEQDLATKSLLEVCAQQWATCVRMARNDLLAIPANRCLEIRYEQFTNDQFQVQRICEFLELSDQSRVQKFYRQSLKKSRGGRWEQLTEDPSWQKALEIMLPQLEALGYGGLPSDARRVA